MSDEAEAGLKHTVLIADDDDTARTLLKSVLQASGLRVVAEAADGRQALNDAQRLQPDVVCLDIDMPQMSGLDVLARLRVDNSKLVALVITASPTAKNVREAIQVKADGVIAKPFNQAKIKSEIDRALKRKHLLK
ncbi:MAG TPA: response regulator [Steroidobacteraceae bacterium]|nr:response regulator [Steroidobacteraceae bacterium]